jgi:hypothetical protein
MADNTIVIEFEPCEPAPADGYKIFYRPIGSVAAYREAPQNFTTSPAEWIDALDLFGTVYEGYIQGDCGGGKLGPTVTFVTDGGGGSGSGSSSESGSESGSVDPETATLTFTNYIGGQFMFTLSAPIPSTPIIITGANVLGFAGFTCAGFAIESDNITVGNPLTITSGSTIGLEMGQTPMDCASESWRRGSTITVNGIARSNGDTIVIGGTLVTIIIDEDCAGPYAC